jgi:hypothetical protein
LDADECLRVTAIMRRMIQERENGITQRREDLKTLAARIGRDTGLSTDDALSYLRSKGVNPYTRESLQEFTDNGWDGVERRGIRQPGFTAADLDAVDDRDFAQPESEERVVRRQYTWGE